MTAAQEARVRQVVATARKAGIAPDQGWPRAAEPSLVQRVSALVERGLIPGVSSAPGNAGR